MKPIDLTFKQSKVIFNATQITKKELEETSKTFLQEACVVDAKGIFRNEKMLCKRTGDTGISGLFIERKIDLENLRALKSATVAELEAALGKPLHASGPSGQVTRFIWNWKLYYETSKDSLKAVQIVAGVPPKDAGTNILFLIMSEAQSE